jgi:hypothetical protein
MHLSGHSPAPNSLIKIYCAARAGSWRTRSDSNSIHFALFAGLIDSLEAEANESESASSPPHSRISCRFEGGNDKATGRSMRIGETSSSRMNQRRVEPPESNRSQLQVFVLSFPIVLCNASHHRISDRPKLIMHGSFSSF